MDTDEPILNTMLLMEICKYNNVDIDEEFISNVEITKEDDEINIIQQVFTNIGAKYYRGTCVFSAKMHQSSLNISYTNDYSDYYIT